MNGKEPHIKFLSIPLFSSLESGYSQNHLDSVRASVFEVSPYSFCIPANVSSPEEDAALCLW